MTRHHFILATAGHVDHGKSSLVKALTGTDPDRLPEEKVRGITIDLGFAHLQLPGSRPDGASLDIGIVDVPGHEDFIKNMVAGVGSVDAALLVVAADDGWMPQTEEHLQILTYLGVARAVVALTKADLPGMDLPSQIAAVRERLAETPLAQAPVVPTSTITSSGLAELRAALVHVLEAAGPSRDLGKPRLPVDRVFTLKGVGTVVTGTLSGGSLKKGQSVVLQPEGMLTRIRTVHSHSHDLEQIGPGRRAALGLTDVSVASGDGKAGLDGAHRGQVVTLPELGHATLTWDVRLFRADRSLQGLAGAERDLADGMRVRVHHGSGYSTARLALGTQKAVGLGEHALAQLRFETPVFALAGDRFVLRDWTEQVTLGGGVILDADAERRGFKTATRQANLQGRVDALSDPIKAVQSELKATPILPASMLLKQASFSSAEIAKAVRQLQAEGKLVSAQELIVDGEYWKKLNEEASAAIEAYHRAHLEEIGMPLQALRSALVGRLEVGGTFEALVHALTESDYVQQGTVIRRTTHRPALPGPFEQAGNKLRAELQRKPLDPPGRKELANTPAAQTALRFLVQSGEVVELNSDLVLLRDAYVEATNRIASHLGVHGRATVSVLRQLLGTSRRVIVPLLERLDREGRTRREGDVRVLAKP